MRRIKRYDEDDFLAMMLFLYFAFVHGVVGMFLTFKDISKYKSKVFDAMTSLMPMNLWGIMFCVVAILFILTALQEGKSKNLMMLVGGVMGSLLFGLTAMANTELASNPTNTLNYAIISSFDLIFAFVGGVALWKSKR